MRKNKVTNMEDYLKLKIYGKQSLKKLDDYKNDFYKFVTSEAMNEFSNQLDELQGWIQIDGKDYNNAYESEEIQGILYDYLNKLYNVIKEVVFDETRNILRYSYNLDKTYLQQSFDYKNLNISDKLNITDIGHFRSTEEFDETIESLFYYVLIRIQRSSGDKADELYKEYLNNN
jgi:phosphoserine aminotransferase